MSNETPKVVVAPPHAITRIRETITKEGVVIKQTIEKPKKKK